MPALGGGCRHRRARPLPAAHHPPLTAHRRRPLPSLQSPEARPHQGRGHCAGFSPSPLLPGGRGPAAVVPAVRLAGALGHGTGATASWVWRHWQPGPEPGGPAVRAKRGHCWTQETADSNSPRCPQLPTLPGRPCASGGRGLAMSPGPWPFFSRGPQHSRGSAPKV